MLEQYAVVGSIVSSLCAVAAIVVSIISMKIARKARGEDKQEDRKEKSEAKHLAEHERITGELDALYADQQSIKGNYLDRFGKVQDTIHETRLDLTEQLYNLKTETLLGIQRIQEMIIEKL